MPGVDEEARVDAIRLAVDRAAGLATAVTAADDPGDNRLFTPACRTGPD